MLAGPLPTDKLPPLPTVTVPPLVWYPTLKLPTDVAPLRFKVPVPALVKATVSLSPVTLPLTVSVALLLTVQVWLAASATFAEMVCSSVPAAGVLT